MKTKYIIISLLLSILIFSASCDKGFEDINKHPFETVETEVTALFNKVVSTLIMGWNEQFYINNEVLYRQTELGALTQEGWQNISIGTEEVWKDYYTTLAIIRNIDKRLQQNKDDNSYNDELAMVKVLLAIKTFKITDLFGDIPFFDAGKGFEDLAFARPKFDSQKDIYTYLLEELKWAEANLKTGHSVFANYDLLYNGNVLSWRKLANSLRLRYAMRISHKLPELSNEIIKDIIDNNLPLISEDKDNLVMTPNKQNWVNDAVNWSFREHGKLRMGETIWRQFSRSDSVNGSGIFDPRAYIFYETNNNKQWKAFPQTIGHNVPSEGGIPYNLSRDNNYFIKGADCKFSPFNYYLIREEKSIPEIIFTYSEVKFLLAEAYYRGIGTTQNIPFAQNNYIDAVVASITFWQDIVKNTERWVHHEPFLDYSQIFAVTNNPEIDIFSIPIDKILERIYAQYWISLFRQPSEAFALVRRTMQTPRTGEPLKYFRLQYPPTEAQYNSENYFNQISKMGSDNTEIKVWWME